MSENVRTVKMALVNPGETTAEGEFTCSFQPRYNPARTVQFELVPTDAEQLHKSLTAYLKAAQKAAKKAK